MPTGIVERSARKIKQVRDVGFANVLAYLRAKRRAAQPGPPFSFRVSTSRFPLYCRPQTTDIECLFQLFVEEQYRCLDAFRGARRILDLGANVGYASAYLLSRHADAEVIAVEPEAGNFMMLRRNTAGFGERFRAVQGAIWSHVADLKFEPNGDGEWGFTVRECDDGETPDLRSIDIATLLDRFGWERVDILKMDIEGAETAVFAANGDAWLPRVRCIAIETHSDDARRVFAEAVAPYGPEMSEQGELTICRLTKNE